MARTRISTTVDGGLLADARRLHGDSSNDAELIGAALAALLRAYRATEVDAAYNIAYENDPIGGPDDWGDLESFRKGAAAS